MSAIFILAWKVKVAKFLAYQREIAEAFHDALYPSTHNPHTCWQCRQLEKDIQEMDARVPKQPYVSNGITFK